MIELEPDIAFEYLDDGGLAVCQLERGDYWQLAAPAGKVWSWIWETRDFATVCERVREEFGVSEEEAAAGLLILLDDLANRGLVTDVELPEERVES